MYRKHEALRPNPNLSKTSGQAFINSIALWVWYLAVLYLVNNPLSCPLPLAPDSGALLPLNAINRLSLKQMRYL